MTFALLHIIGAVALMLWGTRMVKNGFTRAYATHLQKFIAKNTNNRVKAFFAGLGVTAVLQSSTATALVVSSFASKNLIGTAAGLSVMIGADVSTTLVAQILTFDLSWIMPGFLLLGVIMHHYYEHKGRRRHLARAFIGLGLILLSLSLIKETALPLGQSETLPLILKPLESEPFIALVIAALMTWLLHSSLAAVLIISSFAASGLVSIHLGLLLVLGANLGGAFLAFIMTYKMGTQAKRITGGNLLMRALSVLIIIPFIDVFVDFFGDLGIAGSREIVHFHTSFNVLLAIFFLPFVTNVSKLCHSLFPTQEDDINKDEHPQYLDSASLQSPTIALASAARETLRVAEVVEEMFAMSMTALKKEDTKILTRIHTLEKQVDILHHEIKLYLTRLNEETLDPKESDRFIQIMGFSTNLEHIGDVIDVSISELIKSKIENKVRFSQEGFQEIVEFHQIILKNMQIAQAIFMSEDPKLARELVEGKTKVRNAASKSTQRHFQRLREGLPDTISTSALHTDLIRDYRRVNTYITTVAYSILENAEAYKDQRKSE
ncbi:MAG: Na/Pi cotransporter family protein [Alphaproteobacteria bacterium]|nr:Na/Pi cotransporter family protein [Alphaproteobacteria bacterium]